MKNADTLIHLVLNEGRKIIKWGRYTTKGTPQSIKNRTKKYDKIRRPKSNRNKDRQASDHSYGLGKSRNDNLNAVVRTVLPRLGSLLSHTYDEEQNKSSYHGITLRLNAGENPFDHNMYSGNTSDDAHKVWHEYDRHLTDLANHIHRHVKRINRKIGNPESGSHSATAFHDANEHSGFGADFSQLGEIIASHAHGTSLDHLVNPSDRKIAEWDPKGAITLKMKLDRFYRGGLVFYDKRTSSGDFGSLEYEEPKVVKSVISKSKKISLKKGFGTGQRDQAPRSNWPKPQKTRNGPDRGGDSLSNPTRKNRHKKIMKDLDRLDPKRLP